MNNIENLNWHIHIHSLCASLSKFYYSMKSLKDITSFQMTRTIYYAYFQSQMKYDIIFWGKNRDSVKDLCTEKSYLINFWCKDP